MMGLRFSHMKEVVFLVDGGFVLLIFPAQIISFLLWTPHLN